MKTLLKPKDLALGLGLSLATISRMSSSGALPSILIAAGKRKKVFRYDEGEVEKWLKERHSTTREKIRAGRRARNGATLATENGEISQPIETKNESATAHLSARLAPEIFASNREHIT